MEKTVLYELIALATRLMEREESLDMVDTEAAIMDCAVIQLIQERFSGKSLQFFSQELEKVLLQDWNKINGLIRSVVISEYNEFLPGNSAKKWGIKTNGLAFIIVLCAEGLRGL